MRDKYDYYIQESYKDIHPSSASDLLEDFLKHFEPNPRILRILKYKTEYNMEVEDFKSSIEEIRLCKLGVENPKELLKRMKDKTSVEYKIATYYNNFNWMRYPEDYDNDIKKVHLRTYNLCRRIGKGSREFAEHHRFEVLKLKKLLKREGVVNCDSLKGIVEEFFLTRKNEDHTKLRYVKGIEHKSVKIDLSSIYIGGESLDSLFHSLQVEFDKHEKDTGNDLEFDTDEISIEGIKSEFEKGRDIITKAMKALAAKICMIKEAKTAISKSTQTDVEQFSKFVDDICELEISDENTLTEY